jgi:hypothetical protein
MIFLDCIKLSGKSWPIRLCGWKEFPSTQDLMPWPMPGYSFSSMDVAVVNRPFASLVVLATLVGSSFAAEPTPAQRPVRSGQAAPTRTTQAKPTATRSTTTRDPNLIGAGVKRTSASAEQTPAKAESSVKQASASSQRVVRTSANMVHNEVVHEGPISASGGEYIVDDSIPPGPSSSSCSSCGSGGCDGGSCGGGSCGGTSCDSSGFGPCGFDLCSPGPGRRRQLCICLPSHGWAQFDYLMWWQRGMNVPPLLTTSSAASAGVLFRNDTTALIGNEDLLTDRMNGGRIRFGWWFANCPKLGIEGEYFGFKTQHFDQNIQSGGTPVLARPFFNVAATDNTGATSVPSRQDSQIIASPNISSGNFRTSAFSTLDGAAVRFRRMLCCGTDCGYSPFCCTPVPTQSRIDLTLGWRFMQLQEGLDLVERTNEAGTNPRVSYDINDSFRTRNQFNGGEVGFLWSQRRGYFTLDALMRCGIGNTRQEVSINGSTVISQNGTAGPVQNGGFLAQSSNSGTHVREQFGLIPEFGLNLGYALTQNWNFRVGYSFIYWSNVVRPGEHIDLDINPNFFPASGTTTFAGDTRKPDFNFNETSYWVHGLNLGAEYRW